MTTNVPNAAPRTPEDADPTSAVLGAEVAASAGPVVEGAVGEEVVEPVDTSSGPRRKAARNVGG